MSEETILSSPETPEADTQPATAPASGFDFRQSIPEEFAGNACLADIPDYGTLIKNYVNAQSQIGKPFQAPAADAPEEERAAFAERMGVPRDLTGYKAEFEKDNLDFSHEATQQFAEAARKRNIPPSALIGLMNDYMAITGADINGAPTGPTEEQAQAQMSKVVADLRTEWGGTYDRQLGLAQQVVKSYPGLSESLAASGAGNDPAVIRAFAAIGASLANEGLIDGSAVGAVSREDALSQANALMVTDAYLNSSDPAHKATLAKVTSLFESAYPNK